MSRTALLAHRASLLHRLRQFATCLSSSSSPLSSSFTFCTQALLLDSEPLTTKEEEGTSAAVLATTEPSSKWVILPAVPRARGLALVLGQSELTAIKWVTRCCPEISHNAIEKLFRMRQVRVCSQEADCEEAEQARLKRIGRKEIVPAGSIVYLPRVVLQRMESKESETEVVSLQEKRKFTLTKRVYKPTHDDIEWARELIIHMDDHIIAINKPPGLAVQGGSGVGRSLDDLLGPAFSFNYKESPKLVHRLDKDTSGLLVLGRTQESAAILHDMFRSKTANATSSGCKESDRIRSIKRKYWALIIGVPTKRKGRIIAPLKKVVLDGGKSEAIVVADDSSSEDAVEAITEYRVLGSSLHGCTWLELHPHTGRKHQLRVHCAQALGMPILGDYKYGRLVHEKWFSEADESGASPESAGEGSQNVTPKRNDLAAFTDVKGSITSERPFLHLHSRLVAISKIRDLKKKKPLTARGHVSKDKLSFVDSLRLLAPLPPHMKASWSLLPPTLKKDLHQQFVEKLCVKNKSS